MFESPWRGLLPGRHVEFQDEQGDGDREDAVGAGLQAAGGQLSVPVPSAAAAPSAGVPPRFRRIDRPMCPPVTS